MRRLFFALLVASAFSFLAVAGCGDPDDAGSDAGPEPDAGALPDAGQADGGGDAGSELDAGVEDGGATEDAGTDAGVDAGEPISFSKHVQPLFDSKCISCHATSPDGGAGQGSLELEASESWGELVDVNATHSSCSSLKRVAPASAMTSLLYLKVTGAQGKCGDSMPQGSTLPSAQAKLIADWINAGAPNN